MAKFQTSLTKPKNVITVFGLPYRAVRFRLKLAQDSLMVALEQEQNEVVPA
jgi:hypothetical protein